MMATQSSVKEVIDFELDHGVIAELPEGSAVIEASSFGNSAWTRTARIRVQLPNGSQKVYFLKVRRLNIRPFAFPYHIRQMLSWKSCMLPALVISLPS
jgi:hypothetical protein